MTISKYLVAKKENSQLKCISLKLRVLIYIEGVFLLLTHPQCKGHRADIWRRPGAKHCSSLCSQSEGSEYCGGQARVENPIKSCPRALVMFATCSWPSLCEQSKLQCWRRNRRLCGPLQISAARALPLTFDNSILNILPLAAFVFLQKQGDRQGANGKRRPLVFRSCRVLYPSPSVCKKQAAKIKILYI